MVRRGIGGSVWHRWRFPRAVGAGVGLITGFIGYSQRNFCFRLTWEGSVERLVVGGTVVYRSEERLFKVVCHALIADVVSSIAVLVLVSIAYLTMVWLTEGLAVISAIWLSIMYAVFGSLLAIPAAVIPLGITGASATVTSLIRQRTAEPAVLRQPKPGL